MFHDIISEHEAGSEWVYEMSLMARPPPPARFIEPRVFPLGTASITGGRRRRRVFPAAMKMHEKRSLTGMPQICHVGRTGSRQPLLPRLWCLILCARQLSFYNPSRRPII